jgi:hypothetical protein
MLLQGQTVAVVARDFIEQQKSIAHVRIAGLPPQGVAAHALLVHPATCR